MDKIVGKNGEIFLLIAVFITFNTMFCMDEIDNNVHKKDEIQKLLLRKDEIQELLLHYENEFTRRDLYNFMFVDKGFNELIKQKAKSKFEKFIQRDASWVNPGNSLFFRIYESGSCFNVIFNRFIKHVFLEDTLFIDNDRFSFFGYGRDNDNRVLPRLLKYSWSPLLGHGTKECNMTYKGRQYSLILYSSFPYLVRAILSSTVVNYIKATKNQASMLGYDLSGVEIPENYTECLPSFRVGLVGPCLPFNELNNYWKKPIIERYEEQKLEQQK